MNSAKLNYSETYRGETILRATPLTPLKWEDPRPLALTEEALDDELSEPDIYRVNHPETAIFLRPSTC